ncbi:1327_t:CDS:2, partial [Racocetra persica]
RQKLENKFNFDPAQKVRDMVEEMRKAIEKSGRGGSENDNGQDGNNGGEGNDDLNGNSSKRTSQRREGGNDAQSNQQLIILAVEELELPEVKKIIEQCTEKINKTSLKELDKVKKHAIGLIEQERFKRRKEHWRRQVHN